MNAFSRARRIFNIQAAVAAAFLLLAGAGVATAAEDEKSFPAEEVLAAGAGDDKVLGSPDAKVTVIEYASLTCGHCAHFHEKTLPELKKKYVDTGKVRFIFRDFPLDPLATAGSMLAHCAPGDRYFDVLGTLFEQQQFWAFTDKPVDALIALSRQLGFTQESFDACLTNQELLDRLNKVKQTAAEKFDVHSTPSFFVNGTLVRGALSVEEFGKILDPLL
ncbi:MAG: DsbA family protein [Hyphomicrobiales bacterium]